MNARLPHRRPIAFATVRDMAEFYRMSTSWMRELAYAHGAIVRLGRRIFVRIFADVKEEIERTKDRNSREPAEAADLAGILPDRPTHDPEDRSVAASTGGAAAKGARP